MKKFLIFFLPIFVLLTFAFANNEEATNDEISLDESFLDPDGESFEEIFIDDEDLDVHRPGPRWHYICHQPALRFCKDRCWITWPYHGWRYNRCLDNCNANNCRWVYR